MMTLALRKVPHDARGLDDFSHGLSANPTQEARAFDSEPSPVTGHVGVGPEHRGGSLSTWSFHN